MPRSKETSDEAEPLNPASLEKNISTEYIKEWPETHSVRRRAFLSKTSIVLMHLAIVALYTVIFFWVLENHALASKQDAGLMYCKFSTLLYTFIPFSYPRQPLQEKL